MSMEEEGGTAQLKDCDMVNGTDKQKVKKRNLDIMRETDEYKVKTYIIFEKI